MVSGDMLVVLGNMLILVGFASFTSRQQNVIMLMISLEVMLLGINRGLMGASSVWDDLMGQVFTLFILTVAAAEAAIGLAILVVYSKVRGNVDLEGVSLLHG